ncbi:hypothetical protein D3C78_1719040 [compost metagenome]
MPLNRMRSAAAMAWVEANAMAAVSRPGMKRCIGHLFVFIGGAHDIERKRSADLCR